MRSSPPHVHEPRYSAPVRRPTQVPQRMIEPSRQYPVSNEESPTKHLPPIVPVRGNGQRRPMQWNSSPPFFDATVHRNRHEPIAMEV